MKYEDEFVAYLYETYNIGNDHILIGYMEDGVTYAEWLQDMGLEDE